MVISEIVLNLQTKIISELKPYDMTKVKFLLSLAAAAALTVNLSAQTLEDINKFVADGAAAAQAKDYAKAVESLTQAVEQGASIDGAAETVTKARGFLTQVYYLRGTAAAKTNDFKNAIADLTQARDLAELSGNLNLQRQAAQLIGQVFFASGADAYNNERYAEAVEIFAQGFEADPRNTAMALNLARSYDKLDSLEKSVEVYNSVIALEGTHDRYAEPAAEAKKEVAEAVLVRAAAAGGEGNLAEVIRLSELIPTDPAAALLRVQVANNQKNYPAVIESAPAAAELQTDEAKKSDIYFLLASAYQNTENVAKALENYRKVTAGDNAAQARTMITELSK